MFLIPLKCQSTEIMYVCSVLFVHFFFSNLIMLVRRIEKRDTRCGLISFSYRNFLAKNVCDRLEIIHLLRIV